MAELDIEVRLGFQADNLARAEEVWKAINEAIDWADGVYPYACEGTILGENGGDLEEVLKRTPGEVMARLKGEEDEFSG